MTFLLKNCSKLVFGQHFIKICSNQGQQVQLNGLKTTAAFCNLKKQTPDTVREVDDAAKAKKKNKEIPKITLLQNKNMTISTLENAKSLAKRRSLHLVKVQDMDSKTQRPVYKLLTATELLQTDLNDLANENAASGNQSTTTTTTTTGSSKKSEKSLSIGSRIAEHDLASRLKKISKWLEKQHEVRILIQGNSEKDVGSCEKIFKAVEEVIKTGQAAGKIVQKQTKGGIIRFTILPVAAATNDTTSTTSQ